MRKEFYGFLVALLVNVIGIVISTGMLLIKIDDWERYTWLQVGLPYLFFTVLSLIISAAVLGALIAGPEYDYEDLEPGNIYPRS